MDFLSYKRTNHSITILYYLISVDMLSMKYFVLKFAISGKNWVSLSLIYHTRFHTTPVYHAKQFEHLNLLLYLYTCIALVTRSKMTEI